MRFRQLSSTIENRRMTTETFKLKMGFLKAEKFKWSFLPEIKIKLIVLNTHMCMAEVRKTDTFAENADVVFGLLVIK